jgi:hypothetical protein
MAHDPLAQYSPLDDSPAGPPGGAPPADVATTSQPSFLPLLIIGGVLLAWTVFLSWQMLVVNARPIDSWSNKSITGLVFFWVITLGFLALGTAQIRPRLRYLRTTTAAQRVVLDAQAQAERRRRRLLARTGRAMERDSGVRKVPEEPPQGD